MRHWVASLLLLATFVVTGAPPRVVHFANRAHPSTASDASKHDQDSCTAERGVAIRLAPSMLRYELGTLRRFAALTGLDARYARALGSGFSPEEWLRDQRQSIRRVCQRYAAPEWPIA